MESDEEMLMKGGCCHNLRLLFVFHISLGNTGQGSTHARVCCRRVGQGKVPFHNMILSSALHQDLMLQ